MLDLDQVGKDHLLVEQPGTQVVDPENVSGLRILLEAQVEVVEGCFHNGFKHGILAVFRQNQETASWVP